MFGKIYHKKCLKEKTKKLGEIPPDWKQPKCLWIVKWLSLKDAHNLLSENQCQRLSP